MNNFNDLFESIKQSQEEEPRKKGSPFGFFFFPILIIILLIVINNVYIVQADEYKIVRQFGEIIKVIDSPGLNIKTPFIQSLSTLPKKTLLNDVPPAEINTLDKKRILVDYYAMWEVTDPKTMIENLRTLTGAEDRLGDIIYSNIRTELGKLNYDQIINPQKDSRNIIDDVIRDKVNEVLEQNNLGVKLVDIKMKRADLPAVNEQSVYLRMISERESTAQEYLSQGDAEALKIKAESDRVYDEIIAKAQAEAKLIEAEGEKESARIYNEAYGKDPEFFAMYRALESYKTTIDDETVIVLPIKSPYLKYLMGN